MKCVIYKNFLVPLQAFLIYQPIPYMLQDAMNLVSKMGVWYVFVLGLYIHIYGSMKEPHKLPHYASENLILLNISYQTYFNGLTLE